MKTTKKMEYSFLTPLTIYLSTITAEGLFFNAFSPILRRVKICVSFLIALYKVAGRKEYNRGLQMDVQCY
jgi:hypothetical protein